MRRIHLLSLVLFLCLVGPARADQLGVTDLLAAANAESRYGGDGSGTVGFQLSGTWSATITFEATINGTTWTSVYAYNRASGTGATTATSNGTYVVSTAGVRYVRARVSAYTSGTVSVTGLLSPEQSVMDGGASGGGGDASAANQATEIGHLAAIQTAAEIMDDWDETDRAKVNLIAGQAGITGGAGAAAANTPRVIHASDDPVAASAGVMDDWDESDRAKVNLIVGQAGIAGDTGSAGPNVTRVVLAKDQAVKLYATRASKWFYAPPTAGLTSTTAVKVKNGAAGLRACVTSVQVMTTHQTTSTEVVVFASPGAGASTDTLWRGWAQAAGGGAAPPFPVDLCTPNTGDSLKVRELTATSTAGVLVNLQGYTTAE